MDQLNSLVAIMSNDHGDTVIQEEFLYRIGEEYFVFHQKNRALLFLRRQGCSRLHMTEEGIMPKPAKCFQPHLPLPARRRKRSEMVRLSHQGRPHSPLHERHARA